MGYKIQIDPLGLEKLVQQNLNIKQIAERLNMTPKSLSRILIRDNIKIISSRYRLNTIHNYFNKIDTEDKAYILGFILADGCVSIEPKKKNGEIYSYTKLLCFCNSIDDIEVLEKIKTAISIDSKLLYFHNLKDGSNRKPQVSLKIRSQQIVDDLIKLNITPRKTYDINFVFDFNNIPDFLIRHFIRGFFDGDGCFNPSGKTFQFVSTSLPFMEQIQQLFLYNFPNIKSNIRTQKGKNMYFYQLYLNAGYGKYKLVFDYLYKDATIFLSRKYNKFVPVNTEIISEIAKGSETS